MHYLITESVSSPGTQVTLLVNYQTGGSTPTSALSVGSRHDLLPNKAIGSIWVNNDRNMPMTKSGNKWGYSSNVISVVAVEYGSH